MISLHRYHHIRLQWNLSITDTLRPEKQFVIQRFPLFRGYFICTAIYQDPQKQSVIERFPLLGEFVVRGSTVSLSLSMHSYSAGAGRTGTFIAIDTTLDRLEEENTINIFECVEIMRTRRTQMVQNVVSDICYNLF